MAPFSMATTPKCKGGCYSIPWIAPLTLDTYLIMLRLNQGGIMYHFLSLLYDSIWDWTSVSQTIGEYSNHYDNGPLKTYIKNKIFNVFICSYSKMFEWIHPQVPLTTLSVMFFLRSYGVSSLLTSGTFNWVTQLVLINPQRVARDVFVTQKTIRLYTK